MSGARGVQWCAELERDRQQLLTDLDALRVHLHHHHQQQHDVRDAESSRDVTARESRDQGGGGGGDDVTGESAPAADTDTSAGRLVAAEHAAARYRDALRRKVVIATVIHAARLVCEPGSL